MVQKISNIITDRSIPQFIRDDFPMFVSWIGAYYDYLSLVGNPNEIIQNLLVNSDIDTTMDDFLQHFINKYAALLPNDIVADKRLVIKHIKQFYSRKGTEAGFRFLFRILYGEDVEFLYPKLNILKCSDGKWQQTISVKIAQNGISNNQFLFNAKLTGAVSNASAEVDSILTYTDRGVPVYELLLSGLRGVFVYGEEILINGISHSPQIFVLQVVSGIQIDNGGFKYNVGDLCNIIDQANGNAIVGNATVAATDRGPIAGFNVIAGGRGYRGELREVVDFAYLPMGYTLEGVYLPDAIIGGSSFNEDFYPEMISHSIPTQLLPDVGDTITVFDTPEPVGTGATGIVHLVDQLGAILQANVVNPGAEYDFPMATVNSLTGSGAILDVLGGGGRIVAVQLNSFPVVNGVINNTPVSDQLGVDFSPSPTGSGASGTILVRGGLMKYPGTWANDDGKLSSQPKLEDNYFYQDFSYVILSKVNHYKWQDTIGKLSHPAGFLAFGQLKCKSIVHNPLPSVLETSTSVQAKGYLELTAGGLLELTEGGLTITA